MSAHDEDDMSLAGDTNIFGTLISKLDFGDELYLHASDTTGTPLINFKLKGTENYKVWSCAMELALETKNKMGFINGTCLKPTDNDVLARQWDRCNSVVLTWILSSVSEELYLGQIFSKNAQAVWLELKETYDKVDGSITFNLHHKIHSLTQNGSSVSDYYHKLNSLWKQFDSITKLPVCTCNAAKEIQEHNQLLKLMQFLMGLDDVYLPIRSNILTRDPLPNVKSAFAIISREESHRGVPPAENSSRPQNSAFVAKTFDNKKKNYENSGYNRNFDNKNSPNRNSETRRGPNTNLKCTRCSKVGHTIDRCYEIYGYPPGYGRDTNARRPGQQPFFRQNNNAQTNEASTSGASPSNSPNLSSESGSGSTHTMTFTSDQYAKLMNLLSDRPSTSGVHANMAGFENKESDWEW